MSSTIIYTTICSCVICHKQYSSKGIHSHYFRQHTKEGNDISRVSGSNNSKSIEIAKGIAKQKRQEYIKSPNTCSLCNNPLPYDKRHFKFCSRSCSAKQQNTSRPPGHISRTKGNEARSIKSKSRIKQYCKVSFCTECGAVIRNTHRKTCSLICRSKIFSRVATNNPMLGGNKNNKAYGWYTSPSAGKVYLESSYELKVATELDSNNIAWTRPPYLRYGSKKYFPDFYLVDYDTYLDPKNDYLITQDTDKINQVMVENNVKIFILTKDQLTWGAISSVLVENSEIST